MSKVEGRSHWRVYHIFWTEKPLMSLSLSFSSIGNQVSLLYKTPQKRMKWFVIQQSLIIRRWSGFLHWIQNCYVSFYPSFTKPKHVFTGFSICTMWSFLRKKKKHVKKKKGLKMSKDFWEKSASFFSKRKIPFLIQKCGFTHVKMCIYTDSGLFTWN